MTVVSLVEQPVNKAVSLWRLVYMNISFPWTARNPPAAMLLKETKENGKIFRTHFNIVPRRYLRTASEAE